MVESDEYYRKNTSVIVNHTSEQQSGCSLKGPISRDDGKIYLSESDDIYNMKVDSSQQHIRGQRSITHQSYGYVGGKCWGITWIHRSPSRPRPSMRLTAAFINIHEHLI